METRAPFVIVGAFVLAAIAAVFGFVYWLNNAGGIGKRESYEVVFNGPVPGLLVGAAVLFNGIRVGEVTSLELVADRPSNVHATIAVAEYTPVRSDTKVGLDFQGLTGVPVVSLEGGENAGAPPVRGPLTADKAAGQSMTQAARDALRKVDAVLGENAAPLGPHHRRHLHCDERALHPEPIAGEGLRACHLERASIETRWDWCVARVRISGAVPHLRSVSRH